MEKPLCKLSDASSFAGYLWLSQFAKNEPEIGSHLIFYSFFSVVIRLEEFSESSSRALMNSFRANSIHGGLR